MGSVWLGSGNMAIHVCRACDLRCQPAELGPAAQRCCSSRLCLLPSATWCSAWADHFDAIGADYVFWSAKAGMDELSTGGSDVPC